MAPITVKLPVNQFKEKDIQGNSHWLIFLTRNLAALREQSFSCFDFLHFAQIICEFLLFKLYRL